ncbi:MAG: hypothetical protein ACPGVU_10430 [Limisphaerales bacterium]
MKTAGREVQAPHPLIAMTGVHVHPAVGLKPRSDYLGFRNHHGMGAHGVKATLMNLALNGQQLNQAVNIYNQLVYDRNPDFVVAHGRSDFLTALSPVSKILIYSILTLGILHFAAEDSRAFVYFQF